MQTLQSLIDLLTRGRRLHISILDICGILNTPHTKIDFKNVIHSKKFCDIAKSTERGFRLCLYCKGLANTRATSRGEAFCGRCAYGIIECAKPLIINGGVAAVVYVGNALTDTDSTRDRIERTCRYTGVDKDALFNELQNCEPIDNTDELFAIADIVCDYIKLLAKAAPEEKAHTHWLVEAIKRHADEEFLKNPELKELAAIYHKNEKYMGRLFNREMGISFQRYCLNLRLEKAEARILETSDRIIDIAYDSGFENVSYFNRAFKEKYGTPPTEYRRKLRQKLNAAE